MTARRLLLVVVMALAPLGPSPAEAIPNTCPTNGPDAGTVNITEPPAGATFAGQVTVRGRASAPSGLTRVELFVGEALKDFQLFGPGLTDLEFLLRFEVASVQTPTATLSVVACGGTPGRAVRGIASIDVQVARSAVVTTPPIAITRRERTDVRPGAESRTGPAWVGAAFGIAGLVGLVAAGRVRAVRAASAPSRAAGTADPGPVRRRREREASGHGSAPRRPSPAPTTAQQATPAGRRAPAPARRAGARAPAADPATSGRDGRKPVARRAEGRALRAAARPEDRPAPEPAQGEGPQPENGWARGPAARKLASRSRDRREPADAPGARDAEWARDPTDGEASKNVDGAEGPRPPPPGRERPGSRWARRPGPTAGDERPARRA